MKNLRTAGLIFSVLLLFAFESKPAGKVQKEAHTTPPSARFEPSSIDFGDQVTKKPSKYQRITVTNTGEAKLYINSVNITGDDRQSFTLVGDTCTGSTIESKKSCVVDVCFTPARTEGHKAVIQFTDSAADSPQSVSVSGKGINSAAVRP